MKQQLTTFAKRNVREIIQETVKEKVKGDVDLLPWYATEFLQWSIAREFNNSSFQNLEQLLLIEQNIIIRDSISDTLSTFNVEEFFKELVNEKDMDDFINYIKTNN